MSADEWHCRQIPNGMNPVVVCEAESLRAENLALRLVVRALVDPDPCHYDHHGYCQAHSLHEQPCPHEVAKEKGWDL